ncbi:MAG: hypothetical protein LBB94_00045 [Clostridiales bacterium]|jgi:hypothetical protein|nr:hypothetical protein [Clostridiales bacterium]
MPRGKITIFFVCLVLMCLFYVNSYAADEIYVLMNGDPVTFDVPPQNINGRVMVPFRAVGEAVGAKVEWDADTESVWMYLDGQYIGLIIGENTIRIGQMGGPEIPVVLDVAPRIIDGRTFVPVRAVSEGLKCDVQWDAASRTVLITSNQSAARTVDSKKELLAVIEENITEQRIKFSVDTTNLTEETISLDICDYFLDVLEARARWWNYSAAGRKYTYIQYNVKYSMYANVSKAIKTNEIWALTPEETEVYQKVSLIVSENVEPGMSEYEKELALHDYLARSTVYDTSSPGETPWDSHTPYGALIKGVAVCNGYSDSFKLLMDAAGIDCDIVYGDAAGADGEIVKHAWNRVKIDGDYYLVDVTWDDAFPDMSDVVIYDYFNLTDEMMSADHAPYTVEHESVSDKYNYFVYNKLLASDQAAVNEIIRAGLQRGSRTIFLRGVNFDVSRMSFEAFAEYFKTNTDLKYSVNPKLNIMRIILR